MEPCPYRQGEGSCFPAPCLASRSCRNGALPLSAGRGPTAAAATTSHWAAMEPCPYRQGEERIWGQSWSISTEPQWSPALIGRERGWSRPVPARPAGRNGALPLSAGRAAAEYVRQHPGCTAAMEPCPYRQGEAAVRGQVDDCDNPRRNGALPLSAGRDLVGQRTVPEHRLAAMEPCPYRQGEYEHTIPQESLRSRPQWSPALIGRERWKSCHATRSSRSGRNGALPLSAGRGCVPPRCHRRQWSAAMEPCPYRQGERQTSRAGRSARRGSPQWSPALIGRERPGTRCRPRSARSGPQWSPALIGRERTPGTVSR